MVIWVMTSLGQLQIILPYLCLCTDFGENMYAFVLGMCFGVRWLVHEICACSA